MRQSSKSRGKKYCPTYNSIGSHRGKEAQALKNIMSSIQFLQERVSHLPDYQAVKKSKITPSTPKMAPKSKVSFKNNTTSNKKRESSGKTRRTEPKGECKIVDGDSKTCKMRRQVVNEYNTIERPQFMDNYMSLQLENFKLEKHNLNLQKQLLEQELIMERRQKQLLKQRLKRIKTQHHEHSQRNTSQEHKTTGHPKTGNPNKFQNIPQQAKVSPFHISPIKIEIPELRIEDQQNMYCSIPAKLASTKIEEDIDSFLLSEENEKRKSQDALVIDQQLWELLDQNKSKASTTRQALGDIANRPKFLRRR